MAPGESRALQDDYYKTPEEGLRRSDTPGMLQECTTWCGRPIFGLQAAIGVNAGGRLHAGDLGTGGDGSQQPQECGTGPGHHLVAKFVECLPLPYK